MRNLIHDFTCNLIRPFKRNRKMAYDSNGNIHCYEKETIALSFKGPGIQLTTETQALSAMLAAMIPAVIDLGLKITTRLIANCIKKYTAEYSIKQSNLNALQDEKTAVPDIAFQRCVKLPGKDKEVNALKIVFTAHNAGTYISGDDEFTGIVYYISELILDYSAAKTCGSGETFDYTIELEPTFIMGKEKKTLKLFPITMHSVPFGNNPFTIEKIGNNTNGSDDKNCEVKKEYVSDIIFLPSGATLTEASVKIIESNPRKVSIQEILDTINAYKDDAKTIINNIIENLPKEEDPDQDNNGGTE